MGLIFNFLCPPLCHTSLCVFNQRVSLTFILGFLLTVTHPSLSVEHSWNLEIDIQSCCLYSYYFFHISQKLIGCTHQWILIHPSNSPPGKILTAGYHFVLLVLQLHHWWSIPCQLGISELALNNFIACLPRPLLRKTITPETLRWSLRCKMFIGEQHL